MDLHVLVCVKVSENDMELVRNYNVAFRFMTKMSTPNMENNRSLIFEKELVLKRKHDNEETKILKAIKISLSFENMITFAHKISNNEEKLEYLTRVCKRHRNQLQKL